MRRSTRSWFVQELDARFKLVLEQFEARGSAAPSSDPTPTREAYEALRAQVAEATHLRATYLAQLAVLDRALHEAKNMQVVRLVARDVLRNAGLERVDDPDRRECFAEHGGGRPVQVAQAAYVDAVTGRLVQQGRLGDAEKDQSA
jgi:1,6-anhydro-N-acetylmuramate kinase